MNKYQKVSFITDTSAQIVQQLDLFKDTPEIAPMLHALASIFNGKPTPEKLVFAILELETGFPTAHLLNLVHDLKYGKSVEKDIKIVALDVIMYLVPELKMVYYIIVIGNLIKKILTKQREVTINGLSGHLTDRISCHGIFNWGHKIEIKNDYFHINASTWSKHSKDGVRYCQEEFKKQAHDKVFLKIGTPYELLSPEIKLDKSSLAQWRNIRFLKTSRKHLYVCYKI